VLLQGAGIVVCPTPVKSIDQCASEAVKLLLTHLFIMAYKNKKDAAGRFSAGFL
jgi:hypothetical protein